MKRVLGFLLICSSFSLQAITLGTYNIRNFDYDTRYDIQTNKPELSKMLSSLQFDILSVQEINNTAEFEKFIAAKLPHHGVELSRCGGAHGQRLGFVYKKSTVELLSFNEDLAISNPKGEEQCDAGSRPLAIALFKVKATGQKFYGLTVHLKSGSRSFALQKRRLQLEIIKKTINELKAKTGVEDFFVAGDFNTTEYTNLGVDYTMLNKTVKDLRMVNLAAKIGCSSYWWGGSDDGIETPSHLDHILATPGLITKKNAKAQVGGHCQKVSCKEVGLKELGISYESVSDHCPISAVIQ